MKAGSGQPVADAALTACRIVNDVKTRCQLTKSGVNGAFSFPVSPVGDYTVEVSPPGSLRATTLRGVVTAGETTDLGVTSLVEPTPIPAGTHLTSIETVNGIPVVYYAEPLTLSIPSPCVAGAAPAGNWRVLDGVGETLRSGALSVVGAVLTGSIPQLYPYSGAGRIETVVTCSGAPSASPSFDIYIDPSGTVYDEYGIPVTGVSVTLERSDNSDGPFVAVPDGSTLMSPANRTNPVITGPDGRFHWDVSAGWYRLVLAKSGCSSQTGAAMNIPPARVDLVTKLHCAAPAPSRALAISGSPTLGAVLTAVSADFGLPSAGFRWLRGGDQLGTGASHTVTEADLGHQLTVEQSFQAAAVTTTEGTQVTFAALTTRASVDAPLRTLTRTPAPTVSGKAKAGSKLKAKVDAWGPAPVALTYAWLRSGTVIPGATAATYKVQPRDGGSRITVRVTGSKATYAAVSRYSAPTKVVPLSKLKAAAVKIKGTPKVGRTLTAATGRWTAGTSFAFQWLRAGKVVRGATGATFTLTAADRGKTIKVRVTGTKQGYKTVAKTSKATKKVK